MHSSSQDLHHQQEQKELVKSGSPVPINVASQSVVTHLSTVVFASSPPPAEVTQPDPHQEPQPVCSPTHPMMSVWKRYQNLIRMVYAQACKSITTFFSQTIYIYSWDMSSYISSVLVSVAAAAARSFTIAYQNLNFKTHTTLNVEDVVYWVGLLITYSNISWPFINIAPICNHFKNVAKNFKII